jgi:hypothetical protein
MMKTRMKKIMSKKRVPVLALALLACVVFMSGIAWAESIEYPVNCTYKYGGTHIAKQWIDEDGILHLRGITYNLNSTGGNITITIDQGGVCNHNYNLVTGDGDFWGDDYVVQVTWEGLTGTFRGSHSGIRTNHYDGCSTHIYQGIDGDFVGWKLRLNGIWNMHPDVKAGSLEGVLQNPHGE